MTEGERKQTAIAVLRCKLETRDIPSLKQVLAMTLEQLLEILQYCPESELYYQRSEETDYSEMTYATALSLTLKLVASTLGPECQLISEVRSEDETSKKASRKRQPETSNAFGKQSKKKAPPTKRTVPLITNKEQEVRGSQAGPKLVKQQEVKCALQVPKGDVKIDIPI